jgi:hypothetical protein
VTIPAGVTVTVAAGTVIKGTQEGTYQDCTIGSGSSPIQVTGSLDVAGTAASPVVFTSVNDNSVGGATGTGSLAAGDWQGIEIENASGGTTISNAVFEYAGTAVTVDELDELEVVNTEFSYNDAAFAVNSTPVVSVLLGQLDCAPPYTSFITGTGDWFGSTGLPGASIDIGSIADLVIPAGLSNVWSAMSLLIPPAGVADNTIPWSLYSCPEAFEIPIPVTPVIVSVATSAPFPAYAVAQGEPK